MRKDLKGHGNKNFVFQFFHGLALPETLTLFKFDLKFEEKKFEFFIRWFLLEVDGARIFTARNLEEH